MSTSSGSDKLGRVRQTIEDSSLGIMREPALLLLVMTLPFLGSILIALLLRTNSRLFPASVAGLVSLIIIVITAFLYPSVMQGGVTRYELEWLPQLGLNRSEEHTSELQSLMRISYAVFCLK